MKIISHNYTGQSLVLVYKDDNGKINNNIVQKSHPNWNAVLAAYKDGNYQTVVSNLNVVKSVEKTFKGLIKIVDKTLFCNGKKINKYLADKLNLFYKEMPNQINRLVKFTENLYSNPSEEVRESLFNFLEHQNFPLTDDGCVLGYKGVSKDFYSKTSGELSLTKGKTKEGRIYNGAGEIIRVAREKVNCDSNNGCSYGLHVGSFDYANNFKGSDGRLMIVKFNPKNVVSVPKDESWKKIRVCEYEVVAEFGEKLNELSDKDFDKPARDKFGRFAKVERKNGQI